MVRELRDVLHHLLPEADGGSAPRLPPPVPVLGVTVGARDAVGALLGWSLAIEMGRRGAPGTLVASTARGSRPLWPDPGKGACGAEFVPSDATTAGLLLRDAGALARRPRSKANGPGPVLVALPPEWLGSGSGSDQGLAWLLVLVTPERPARERTLELLGSAVRLLGTRRISVLAHRATSADAARRIGEDFGRDAEQRLGLAAEVCGGLPDALDVYRSIAERRATGLCARSGPVARALGEAADRLLAAAEPSRTGPREPVAPSPRPGSREPSDVETASPRGMQLSARPL